MCPRPLRLARPRNARRSSPAHFLAAVSQLELRQPRKGESVGACTRGPLPQDDHEGNNDPRSPSDSTSSH
ncbi:hypothetical protein BDW02DRAFT_573919 [Decorospora gaudefroyi]|uniref:Uncharacterized protein n=1 Tax=Decorospora gaudefroyi TaxID=184978 RepID=A0A6A5K577_9PLEO|nr:hypothetical protein BDW02DRAFT_573919 [Decorospora gaudefroyi]